MCRGIIILAYFVLFVVLDHSVFLTSVCVGLSVLVCPFLALDVVGGELGEQ